jgi:hypothetical protein
MIIPHYSAPTLVLIKIVWDRNIGYKINGLVNYDFTKDVAININLAHE